MVNKRILLEAIYSKTGIFITTKSDCRIVSQLISQERLGYLSESTLYRFFIYQNEQSKPYKNTLTIIAKFCGFKDWNDFLKYNNSADLFNEPEFLNHSVNVVFKNLIQAKKYNPLVEIFNSIEEENYKTKEFFGLKTFVNFCDTNSFPEFIKLNGKHPFVRTILIENLYDPFHRIKGYTESIEIYLKDTDKNASSYFQDFLFGNTVLFRHYYLTKNQKAISVGKRLYESDINSIQLSEIHIFPKTRFLAYKLWYLQMIDASDFTREMLLEEINEFIAKEIEAIYTITEFTIIYQTISEVLKNLGYDNFLNKITKTIEKKLIQLNLKNGDLNKDANGLINLI